MPKPKVFVSRIIAREALDRIAAEAEMEIWPEVMPPPYEALKEKASGAEGLLTMLTERVDAGLLDAAPNLKVVSNMAVGYDNIVVPEATRRGVPVGNTPGVLTETTADLIFALLLAGARRIVEADGYTRQGKWKTWEPMTLLGRDVHHSTLGIIGMGRIGAEVAKRARGFDMKILYFNRTRRSPEEEKRLGVEYAPSIPDLLSRSDFISIHVPLNDETRHLIGAEEFALMKPSAVFINTSRGPVVDQQALYDALSTERIFSAAIDVTEKEPIDPDDPLLKLSNLTITPHIGSASFVTRTKMAQMAADNLLAGLKGELPPNCVNPEALQKRGG